MGCCATQGCAYHFGAEAARKDLATYRKSGPDKTTRMLIDALKAEGIHRGTLLDVGGGVGAVQHALVREGISQVTAVDVSAPFLAAAQEEAERQGYADRATYHQGDIVDLQDTIPAADVVTLDRVICCYVDVHGLVSGSAAKARHHYGFVFPRANLYTRLSFWFGNLMHRLKKDPFRAYIHPTETVDALLRAAGFERRSVARTFFWQVMVYGRSTE